MTSRRDESGRSRGRSRTEPTVGRWTIERLLVDARVQGRGPFHECRGGCCEHGVYASLAERDRILEYADDIRAAMDETQTPEVDRWFERKEHRDDDFPGGRCVGTAVHEGKCVFLNREGLCTLQILEGELGLDEHLKPFYCRIFPLCAVGDRIEFDDMCDGLYPCCSLGGAGRSAPVDAYAYEFTEILGPEGYRELRERI